MRNVGIVFRDRLGPGLALKRWYFLPEVIQHSVRRRVPVMGAAVCLAARNNIYSGGLLIQDRGLHDPELSVLHVLRLQFAKRHEAVEGFIPARDAICADN